MKSGQPMLMVSIYLRGDELQPDYVSEVLGVQPSEKQQKGEPITGSKAIAKIGVWALSVPTESRSLAEQADELLEKLGSPRIRLDQIEGVDEAYLDIFVAPDFEHREREAMEGALTRKHVAAFSDLGLSIHLTVS